MPDWWKIPNGTEKGGWRQQTEVLTRETGCERMSGAKFFFPWKENLKFWYVMNKKLALREKHWKISGFIEVLDLI